jgi:hypothetical protein
MAFRLRATASAVLAGVVLSSSTGWGQDSILGFSAASAELERKVEQRFKAIPSADEEKRQHRLFTSEPHPAGSKRNNELAEYMAAEWRKQFSEIKDARARAEFWRKHQDKILR